MHAKSVYLLPILLAGLFTSSCRPTYKLHAPKSVIQTQSTSDMRITQVNVPGIQEPYNASIIEFNDHYLMAFRYDKNKFIFDNVEKEKNQHAYIGLVELDENYRVISEVTTFSPKNSPEDYVSQTEDPRLFAWHDKIYLMYNDSLNGEVSGDRKIFIAEVIPSRDHQGITFAREMRLHYAKENKVEKNWTPLVKDGELYFIYNFEKQVVLKQTSVNHRKGIIELKEATPSINMQNAHKWRFGNMCGGTPAIKDPHDRSRYIAAFHSFTKEFIGNNLYRKYYMGFVEFTLDKGMEIIRKSTFPIVSKDFYQRNNAHKGLQVVFPSGLIATKEKYIVSLGLHDDCIKIAEIPRSLVENSYQPIKLDKLKRFRFFQYDSIGKQIDMHILSQEIGKFATFIDESDEGMADVNVYVEHTEPENIYFMNKAKENWLVINQEWVIDSISTLKRFNRVICKTRHGCQSIAKLKDEYDLPYEITYTSFKTTHVPEESLVPFNKKISRFWHGAGKSPYKNTGTAIEAWNELSAANPTLPSLFGACRNTSGIAWGCFEDHLKNLSPSLYHNQYVDIRTGVIEESEYKDFLDASKFYLAPSAIEGFGHYLAEGMARGAVVITTDAPPMNEFIEDGKNGFLVKHDGHPQFFYGGKAEAYTFKVDKDDLKRVVNKVLAMSDEELEKISRDALASYAALEKDFSERIGRLMETYHWQQEQKGL